MSETLELSAFLPYRLSVLSNRASQGIAALYEDRFGISLPQWRIMAVLGNLPDISARELAKQTAMDKVAVSRSVKKLLTAGLLERHFAAEDKRRSVLALSEKGQDIYQQVVPLAIAWEREFLETLNPDELQQLDLLISKLMESPVFKGSAGA